MGAVANIVGKFFTNPAGAIKDAVNGGAKALGGLMTLDLGKVAEGASEALNGPAPGASASASGSANDMLMAAVMKLLGKSGTEDESNDLQSDMG
ncbi:hypothetical protein [Xylophilus sp. GOD-11R]|uniref:hypothetical protein n=1 Tax=Xylophilus sp. GOD-11R TaxID=3089814 RepID=UPI00298BDE40|nr:hypothetical protein [Xylophilus sp. GOD-11R]WPB56261.1 hypothetical protein R9X41_19265 [Xylophilus sp. GOD-11R]